MLPPEKHEALHQELRETLTRGLDVEDKDIILFALHIGCGAFALGLQRVEPAKNFDPHD